MLSASPAFAPSQAGSELEVCNAKLLSLVHGKPCMWLSISALAESSCCDEPAVKRCIRAGSTTFHFQYAAGFVRIPPAGMSSCLISTKGSPQHIVRNLCMQLTTTEQPWVPVAVVEHVACCCAGLACGQFTKAINDLRPLDWIRLSDGGGAALGGSTSNRS